MGLAPELRRPPLIDTSGTFNTFSEAVPPDAVELVPALGALCPRSGPVQDPVLKLSLQPTGALVLLFCLWFFVALVL